MLQHIRSSKRLSPISLPEKLSFNGAQNQIPLLLIRPFTRVLNPSGAILLDLKYAVSKVPRNSRRGDYTHPFNTVTHNPQLLRPLIQLSSHILPPALLTTRRTCLRRARSPSLPSLLRRSSHHALTRRTIRTTYQEIQISGTDILRPCNPLQAGNGRAGWDHSFGIEELVLRRRQRLAGAPYVEHGDFRRRGPAKDVA
jgi:hypothetical protein